MVISKLDYCNVLLPKKTLHILQWVQNYAVSLILRFGKSEHIKSVLYYIDWLPVELRVDYNVLLWMFRVFYDHAPFYIFEMVTKYKPRRRLRSNDKCMLVVTKNRTTKYRARSFLYVSATLYILCWILCFYWSHCVFHLYPNFYTYLFAIIYLTHICSVTAFWVISKNRYLNIYYFYYLTSHDGWIFSDKRAFSSSTVVHGA